MAEHERDRDQERGMQRRGSGTMEPYGGGELRRYGDREWHRGVDAYGNPVWYRAYGWAWTSGGSQEQRQDQEPHEHGRTTSRHYQRSDQRVCDDVYDRLNDHSNIDSSDIRVTVKDCEVTLEGTVHDRREKRLAEDIAESVSGVRDVQNRLRMEQGQQDRDRTEGPGQQDRGRSDGPGRPEGRPNVREGMKVSGSNGDEVGKVKQVRDRDFLVERDGKREIFIPFDAVDKSKSGDDRLALSVPAGRLDDMGWASPEMTGGQAERSARR